MVLQKGLLLLVRVGHRINLLLLGLQKLPVRVLVLQKGLLLELRVRHQIILLLQWVQDFQTLLLVQGRLRINPLLLVRVQHQTTLVLVRHRKR